MSKNASNQFITDRLNALENKMDKIINILESMDRVLLASEGEAMSYVNKKIRESVGAK